MKHRFSIILIIVFAMLSASCQKAPESLILRLSGQRVEALHTGETEPGVQESEVPEPTEIESGENRTENDPSENGDQTAEEGQTATGQPGTEPTTAGQTGQIVQPVTESAKESAVHPTTGAASGPAASSAQPSTEVSAGTTTRAAAGSVQSSAQTEAETARPMTEEATTPERSTIPTQPAAESTHPATVPQQSATEATHPSTETTQPAAESSSTAAETSAEAAHTAETAQRIEILTLPEKTVYDRYYERISTEGLSLRAFWEDGYERVVTDGYTLGNDNGLIAQDGGYYTYSEGEHLVTIHYGNCIAVFTVSYHLAADAPLTVTTANSRTVFYPGEYTKYCLGNIYLGNQNILDRTQITYVPERITGTGNVTVRCIYGEHVGEMTLTVLPGEQFIPNQDDFEIFRMYYNQVLGHFYDVNHVGIPLSISWLGDSAGGRPVLRDVIPAEEFIFDPAVLTSPGTWPVTVTCRGFTTTIMLTVKK